MIVATVERNKRVLQTGSHDTFRDYEFTNIFANGLRTIGTNRGPRGLKFEGADGQVFVHVHGCKLDAQTQSLPEEKIGPKEIRLGRSPGQRRNFLDCVKSRGKPVTFAGLDHRSASICQLNNIAMLTGRKLKWDPERQRFHRADAANDLLKPKMRSPWTV